MNAKERRYYETAPSDGIQFIYFDIGNVLFRYSGAIAGLATMLGVPTDTMKAFWLQHDPDLCRGTLKPQEFWNIVKNEFQYKGPDIDFADFWVNHFTPIPETHTPSKTLP